MREELILYNFKDGYVKASRYLTKPEIGELEKVYGEYEGYFVSADLVAEFAVCEMLEKAIEQWEAQGKQSLHLKNQAVQTKSNYTKPQKEVSHA